MADAFKSLKGRITNSEGVMYSCPSGKVALIRGLVLCNITGGDVTLQLYKTVSGQNYKIVNGAAVSNAAPYPVTPGEVITLEANESLRSSAGTATSIDYNGSILEKDA